MHFKEGMLRELQKQLTKAAVTLVRTERELTHLAQLVREPAEAAPPGTLCYAALCQSPGRHDLAAHYYSGPPGAYAQVQRPNVATCWAPAGVRFRVEQHPDATEYIFVKRGRLVDALTGETIEQGESYEVPAGQAHEYFFPLETEWVVVYALAVTESHAPDTTRNERWYHVGQTLFKADPYRMEPAGLYQLGA